MTDWKGTFTKVLKEGKLPSLSAPQKVPIINPQEQSPPSLKAIFRYIGKLILFIFGFIILSIVTRELVIRFFDKYGDNYFRLIFFTGSFLLWNWWFFKFQKALKIYKIASAAICGLLFVGLLTSVRDDNNAISLGYRSAEELGFAQSGDFKDQAALDRAIHAGFFKRSELEAAEQAGYHDKASYDKFLETQKAAADVAQKRQAEAQKQAEQAAGDRRRADEEKSASTVTDATNRVSNSTILSDNALLPSGLDRYDGGLTRSEWRQACRNYQEVKDSCAVADNVSRCVTLKLDSDYSNRELMYQTYCDGGVPNFEYFEKK